MASVTFAVGSTTAAGAGQPWTYPDPASLTYSAPASQSGGLTIPTLNPGQRALFSMRRDCTTATIAVPEVTDLYASGTATIGF